MIIIRSPLRISIGGGGTDIPSYYEKKGSFFISAAINKYVYVTLTRPFEKGIYLKYSKIEKVNSINKISHKIIKEVLKQELLEKRIEITTLTDIPTKTGLGSSGSFSTALIKGVYVYNNKSINKDCKPCSNSAISAACLITQILNVLNFNSLSNGWKHIRARLFPRPFSFSALYKLTQTIGNLAD